MTSPAAIDELLEAALADGVCSAAAGAAGDVDRRWTWVRGRARSAPDRGLPIEAATRFDLASLTKPIATAAIAMALVSERRLRLDDRVGRWLDAGAADMTVAHLLGHAAGFPAHRALYQRIWAGDLAGEPDPHRALVRMATSTPLERAPGTAAVYSDLGYIVLGALLERATDRSLAELLGMVTEPLGMAATGYVDLRAPAIAMPSVAAVATEIDGRRGLVVGEVHDENCHAGGGVAGHAGLFAPIDDVAGFAAAMARAARERVGRFRPEVVEQFFTRSAAPETSWRLGWDTPSPIAGVSHAGDRWPRDHAVGHLGFTGTSLWIDWARGRWSVLLTNRVHPRRDRPEAARIKELRRGFGDRTWELLDGA